jgi:hypothetical protein
LTPFEPFFRDGPGGRSLVALDPVGEVATSAGNAAAAVVAAREARGARGTVWAPMDQAQAGSLKGGRGWRRRTVLDAGAGRGGRGDHPGAPRDGPRGEDAARVDAEAAGGCDDRRG